MRQIDSYEGGSSTPPASMEITKLRLDDQLHAMAASTLPIYTRIFGILAKTNKNLQLTYYRYSVILPIYGLQPFEKVILNTLLILGMAFWVFRLGYSALLAVFEYSA